MNPIDPTGSSQYKSSCRNDAIRLTVHGSITSGYQLCHRLLILARVDTRGTDQPLKRVTQQTMGYRSWVSSSMAHYVYRPSSLWHFNILILNNDHCHPHL